jgi:hypothetical protein
VNLLNVLAVATGILFAMAAAVGAGIFILPIHFWFGCIGALVIILGPATTLWLFPSRKKHDMPHAVKHARAPRPR